MAKANSGGRSPRTTRPGRPSAGHQVKLAILAAEYNRSIVDAMVAEDEAVKLGARVMREVRVPGCYDTVLVADRLLAQREVDALVVLGFIERGETLHGEVMGHAVLRALLDLELEHGKPVGLGVIGPGATEQQAQVRKDGHARAAVRAAMRTGEAIASLSREKRA
jgi:6,7-dimethyl-8-ribityllumazine synthase